MESSSPPNRSIMHPNHARSSSTNLPRLSSLSRIPLSPTRSSTTGSSGLLELTENLRYSGPPPPYGAATQAHAALGNITQTSLSNPFNGSKIASNDMDSLKMPPPSKIVTASLKGRSFSLAINNTDTSKRETLAERAGRPSGIAPPGSARSTASGGITKPGSRSTSTAPGTVNRHNTLPRPKSSMERVRPPSFSGTNGSLFRSSQSKPSSVSGGSRPPSAQEMRPASAVEDDSDSSSKEAVLVWQQMQKRLAELEEKFQKDQEEKEKNAANNAGDSWKEKYDAERIKVMELETARAGIESQLSFAKMELEQTKQNLMSLQHAFEEERRERRAEKDDAARRLDREVEEVKRRARDEMDSLTRSHRETMESVERNAREAQESEIRRLKQDLEDEKAARRREVSETQTQAALEKQKLETKMDSKWREIRQMKEEVESIGRELERERLMNAGLRDSLAEHSTASLSMETTTRVMKARMELLENDSKEKLLRMQELEEKTRLAEEQVVVTKEKLRAEESLRRKLHNQVQELKGNIRVFCRVRPPHEHEIDKADIRFPDQDQDAREIEILGKERTATGNVLERKHPFQFDRVFGPTCKNQDVFDEISQLVQSALDGYNVCIFCYGQTGSGKTYTMSSRDGMIPRAVAQIYETATLLKEKGWKYIMEGSFVEVYNENINDLLGRADDLDKKRHEIRHDKDAQKTTVTGLTSVLLDAPDKVEELLRTADGNRSVAATKANERSSRSHSVFMLKLTGVNSITGERSEGTLNLVDLAGSERISQSQVSGDRLKETQSINKSLACLGDVIQALGNGEKNAHIPYRNSKLTYLLQYSLGGNSKTLMFVMVSPLLGHMSETLTSLKFAIKVNNTSIGTAKKAATTRGSRE